MILNGIAVREMFFVGNLSRLKECIIPVAEKVWALVDYTKLETKAAPDILDRFSNQGIEIIICGS